MSSPAADPAGVRVGLLGPLEVRVQRQPRPVAGHNQQVALALLAIDVGRTVDTDRLITAVWGSSPPPSAHSSLAVIVSRLRQVVAPATILKRAPGYVLDLPATAVDAVRFSHWSAEAVRTLDRGDLDASLELVDRALGMWRGAPLEGLHAHGMDAPFRRRLLGERRDLMVHRAEVLVRLGRPGQAIAQLEAVVEEDPGRERVWELLARTLYAGGRQQDALGALRRARQALLEDGLDPTVRLADLETRILAHADEIHLLPPRDTAPVSRAEPPTGPGEGPPAVPQAPGPLPSPDS